MRRFARTYLIALVVLLGVGLLAVGTPRLLTLLGPDYGAPRPTPAQLAGYSMTYRIGKGPDKDLHIATDGSACGALASSDTLRTTCILALNVDPAFIAAEAFGGLNVVDTPAYEAIIWRAVLAGDAGICAAGGLLGERLTHCRTAVADPVYRGTADDITVTIARGQVR